MQRIDTYAESTVDLGAVSSETKGGNIAPEPDTVVGSPLPNAFEEGISVD